MKDHKQTICYKVDKSIDILEEAIKTDNLDVRAIGKLLHDIRLQAQKMEDGLKKRKEIMSKAGLEKDYQLKKGKEGEDSYIRDEIVKGKQLFEISVSQNGKHLYTRKGRAILLTIVERVDELDQMGNITGKVETLVTGHPLAIWYGFDQLSQKIESKRIEIMASIREAVEQSKFVDPKYKKIVKEMTDIL